MAISFRLGLGLMAKGCFDMASISRSQMALPKAQSGADFRTERRASDLPGPLGIRIKRSVMMPFSTATSVARMRSWGILKRRLAERMIHWLDEETAQTSQALARGAP